jgi:hypothetical protein
MDIDGASGCETERFRLVPRHIWQSSVVRHCLHLHGLSPHDRNTFWNWSVSVVALYGAIVLVAIASLISWIDCLGLCAGAAVLATFSMKSMLSLRSIALLSNMLFVTYGIAADLYPIVVLHAILFPINIGKLYELRKTKNDG